MDPWHSQRWAGTRRGGLALAGVGWHSDDAYSREMDGTRPALVVVGTAYHAPTAAALEVLADVAIVVGADGSIVGVHSADSAEAVGAISTALQVVRLTPDQRLLPGLVDLHIHAPQWPQLGTGLDLTLERWLRARLQRRAARGSWCTCNNNGCVGANALF